MTDHNDAATPRLANNDQIELERLALRMALRPEVRQAREQARAMLLADAVTQNPDGAAGLDRALDQWVMGQVASIINADPSRPRLFWSVDNTPRRWCGHVFPGAAVAIDNPDNVNRVAPLDGAWRYELKGQYGEFPTSQMNINVTLAADGQLRWGDAIATFTNRDIVADADGRFTVTMDKDPANGRPNHMQLVDGPLQLAIRDSHGDWRQQATLFDLQVVGGPDKLRQPSDDELATDIASGMQDFVQFWVGFKNTFWNNPSPNQVIGPFGRPREGGWGTQAVGRFQLADSQALVITTLSGGSDYTGFQISDPWMISPTPLHRTTSRNIAQCTANPDGTYTYVIALVDPGVANWIDTAGLHEGWFMLRWQNLGPDAVIEELVRDVTLVDLEDLDQVLREGTPRVTLEQRRDEILDRVAAHQSRLG